MKKEKGITLISLIITVIAITMTLSILAVISSAFFSNTNLLKEDTKGMAEYNKFAMYFIEDTLQIYYIQYIIYQQVKLNLKMVQYILLVVQEIKVYIVIK